MIKHPVKPIKKYKSYTIIFIGKNEAIAIPVIKIIQQYKNIFDLDNLVSMLLFYHFNLAKTNLEIILAYCFITKYMPISKEEKKTTKQHIK